MENFILFRICLMSFLVSFAFCQQSSDISYMKNTLGLVYKKSRAHGGSVYLLSNYPVYYHEAQYACESMGGYVAEVNSETEFTFIQDFVRDQMNEWTFVHVNGYRDSNDGSFSSTIGVDIVAVINEENRNNNNNTHIPGPLYTPWWNNYPRRTSSPPTCIELDKRGSDIKMVNARCDRSIDWFLCERPL